MEAIRAVVSIIALVWIIVNSLGMGYTVLVSLGDPVKALLTLVVGVMLVAPGVFALKWAIGGKRRVMPKFNVGDKVQVTTTLEGVNLPSPGTTGMIQEINEGTGFRGKVPDSQAMMEWSSSTSHIYLVDFGSDIGSKWIPEVILQPDPSSSN